MSVRPIDNAGQATRRVAGRRGPAWYGILGGPVLGLLQQQVVYMLAVWACGSHGLLPLHLVSGLCALGAALATWIAWRELVTIRREPEVTPRRDRPHEPIADQTEAELEDRHVTERVRFMARLGVLSGALALLWIVAMWVAVAALNPCPSPA